MRHTTLSDDPPRERVGSAKAIDLEAPQPSSDCTPKLRKQISRREDRVPAGGARILDGHRIAPYDAAGSEHQPDADGCSRHAYRCESGRHRLPRITLPVEDRTSANRLLIVVEVATDALGEDDVFDDHAPAAVSLTSRRCWKA